jgi:hypothetical protein
MPADDLPSHICIAGPAFLPSSPDVVATGTSLGLSTPPNFVYSVVRHIHVCNVTASSATFDLWVGTVAGQQGNEYVGQQMVPAHYTWDLYCYLLLGANGIFLSGACPSGAANLVITVEGDWFISNYGDNS